MEELIVVHMVCIWKATKWVKVAMDAGPLGLTQGLKHKSDFRYIQMEAWNSSSEFIYFFLPPLQDLQSTPTLFWEKEDTH